MLVNKRNAMIFRRKLLMLQFALVENPMTWDSRPKIFAENIGVDNDPRKHGSTRGMLAAAASRTLVMRGPTPVMA